MKSSPPTRTRPDFSGQSRARLESDVRRLYRHRRRLGPAVQALDLQWETTYRNAELIARMIEEARKSEVCHGVMSVCTHTRHVGPLTPQPRLSGWLGLEWVRCESCRSDIAAPNGPHRYPGCDTPLDADGYCRACDARATMETIRWAREGA